MSAGDRTRRYGELLFRRATGEAEEMESAKSLCRLLAPVYAPGMRVLDAGCGAGHYLRSLRERLERGIDYRGIDRNQRYIELARKAFPAAADRFAVADVNDLPFPDGSFDVVLCINVIPNLPPPPTRALEELLRVSGRYVVIRALFSEVGYVIRELSPCGDREADLIARDGTIRPGRATYNNMYTERYYRELIGDLAPGAEVSVQADDPGREFDNRGSMGPFGTRVEGGRQVSGQLVLDWRYIVLRKG